MMIVQRWNYSGYSVKRNIEGVKGEYNVLIDDEEDRAVELRGSCN